MKKTCALVALSFSILSLQSAQEKTADASKKEVQSYKKKLDTKLEPVINIAPIRKIISDYVDCNVPDYINRKTRSFREPNIDAAAVSPNGTYIATYSRTAGKLRLRAIKTLGIVKEWENQSLKGEARSLQFSHDGTQLILETGDNEVNVLTIFDSATFVPIKEIKVNLGVNQELIAFAYSPDSRLLAVDNGFYLNLFDTKNFTVKKRIITRDDRISALAFSPGGERIAVCKLNSILLLNSETLDEILSPQVPTGFYIDRLLYSPAGDYLAAYGYIYITKRELQRGGYISPAKVSKEHKIVVWESNTMRKIGEEAVDIGVIDRFDFAFLPEYDLLIYGDDKAIKFLCIEGEKQKESILYTYTNNESAPFSLRPIAGGEQVIALSPVYNSSAQLLTLSTS